MKQSRTELEKIYRRAIYVVPAGDSEIRFRIGEKCEESDALLQKRNAETFAFITAYNPRSEILSSEENESRHLEFVKLLSALRFHFLEGYGTSANEAWQREKSLFIFDISEEKATRLGEKFEQNAIVFGEKGNAPRLVRCLREK